MEFVFRMLFMSCYLIPTCFGLDCFRSSFQSHSYLKCSNQKNDIVLVPEDFDLWLNLAMDVFIKHQTVEKVDICPEFSRREGILGNKEIVYRCNAYQSESLRYIRRISFSGAGYNVFNFVALPRSEFNIPIFGVDIVTLPGGTLAAIDFQPLQNSPDYFDSLLYKPYEDIFNKWTTYFPSGGPLPIAAKQYFSPQVLWTRIPPQNSSMLSTLKSAFLDYTECYVDLLSKTSISSRSIARDRVMDEYLEYRIVNDPAKKMLYSTFGADWTEKCLREIMFPKL
eukprot:gene2350-4563_t